MLCVHRLRMSGLTSLPPVGLRQLWGRCHSFIGQHLVVYSNTLRGTKSGQPHCSQQHRTEDGQQRASQDATAVACWATHCRGTALHHPQLHSQSPKASSCRVGARCGSGLAMATTQRGVRPASVSSCFRPSSSAPSRAAVSCTVSSDGNNGRADRRAGAGWLVPSDPRSPWECRLR